MGAQPDTMPQSIGRLSARHSAMLVCAVVVLSMAATTARAQGNLGFLKDTPLAYFKGDDAKLMRAAAAEVLKGGQNGTRKEWKIRLPVTAVRLPC